MDWKTEIERVIEDIKAYIDVAYANSRNMLPDAPYYQGKYSSAMIWRDRLVALLARAEAEAEDGSQQTGNGT